MVILSSLLISGPNSPFYQSLIAPNIGSDYSPGVGYDNGTRDASYSIGLQGIKKDDYPMQLWTCTDHGDNVNVEPWCRSIRYLLINDRLQLFKEKLANGPFLQDKVKECFKDNPHYLTLVMNPDPGYETEQNRKEQEKLKSKVSCLSEEDKTIIYQKGIELAEQQNAIEDVSCLPKMVTSDIDPSVKPVTLEHYISAGVPVQYCEQPTNGITYFRAISSITDTPDALRQYLPLFCFILTKMGAGNLNYLKLSQLMEMRTGGMSLSTHISSHHSDMKAFEQGLEFSSHCLDKNLPHMYFTCGRKYLPDLH
ncbi:Presequence protease, mitochondrial [Desmophyllum pertusum]|uniref:Presequence protease, mitochondrial n=1 Tax=Desmophyllum pertusum TaxID=174260 RepID=A0A9X0D3P2_9CNID|nr:Presequence protease, mitochondrial [Desmophyllum pertusum]